MRSPTIVERAEGVPLYAVETVRMLIDRGQVLAGDDGYALAGPLDRLAVPETLQALVAGRSRSSSVTRSWRFGERR